MKWLLLFFIGIHSITASAQNFRSKHFEIQKLAPSVYAAIALNNGYGICNAGVIDLGTELIVFDPFMTPQAAGDLQRFTQTILKKPVRYVVLSHAHNDHIRGTQMFPGASVIATPVIAQKIIKNEPIDLAEEAIYAPVRKRYYDSIPKATDAWQALENSFWKGYYYALVASNKLVKTIEPSLLFSDSLTLKGADIEVKIISYGDGHTASDLFLYVPKNNIAFMGDLFFNECHPWLGESTPENWINYLQKVQQLNATTYIPGHGPVGGRNEMNAMIGYINDMGIIAAGFTGKPTNEEIAASLPVAYKQWHLRNFYRPNINYMLQKKAGK